MNKGYIHNSNQIFLAPEWMVTGPGTYQQRPWSTKWLPNEC